MQAEQHKKKWVTNKAKKKTNTKPGMFWGGFNPLLDQETKKT